MRWTRERLEALDRADPLAPFRDRFLLPEGIAYLDASSPSALPRATSEAVERMVAVLQERASRPAPRDSRRSGLSGSTCRAPLPESTGRG